MGCHTSCPCCCCFCGGWCCCGEQVGRGDEARSVSCKANKVSKGWTAEDHVRIMPMETRRQWSAGSIGPDGGRREDHPDDDDRRGPYSAEDANFDVDDTEDIGRHCFQVEGLHMEHQQDPEQDQGSLCLPTPKMKKSSFSEPSSSSDSTTSSSTSSSSSCPSPTLPPGSREKPEPEPVRQDHRSMGTTLDRGEDRSRVFPKDEEGLKTVSNFVDEEDPEGQAQVVAAVPPPDLVLVASGQPTSTLDDIDEENSSSLLSSSVCGHSSSSSDNLAGHVLHLEQGRGRQSSSGGPEPSGSLAFSGSAESGFKNIGFVPEVRNAVDSESLEEQESAKYDNCLIDGDDDDDDDDSLAKDLAGNHSGHHDLDPTSDLQLQLYQELVLRFGPDKEFDAIHLQRQVVAEHLGCPAQQICGTKARLGGQTVSNRYLLCNKTIEVDVGSYGDLQDRDVRPLEPDATATVDDQPVDHATKGPTIPRALSAESGHSMNWSNNPGIQFQNVQKVEVTLTPAAHARASARARPATLRSSFHSFITGSLSQ